MDEQPKKPIDSSDFGQEETQNPATYNPKTYFKRAQNNPANPPQKEESPASYRKVDPQAPNTYFKKTNNYGQQDNYYQSGDNNQGYYKKNYNSPEQKPYQRQAYRNPEDDYKPENKATYVKKSDLANSYGKKPYQKQPYRNPEDDYKPENKATYVKKSDLAQNRPYNGGGGGFGGQRSGGFRKPPVYQEPVYEPIVPVYADAPVLSNEREDNEGMRINKYIAHAGMCARRKADELIRAGRVMVNGQVMDQVGYRVQQEDEVTLDGKGIHPDKKYVYILLNKPRNVITTSDDEKGRKTVLDLVTQMTDERVYPVGRLDRDTTGLVLLTNDGELAQRLSHPSHKISKIYEVVLDRPLLKDDLMAIRNTLELNDGPAPVDKVEYVLDSPANVIGIEIHIGKNRIVRRIFESLGYKVLKLDRVKYAMLTKKGIPRGRCRFLDTKEIAMLKYLL
jgi:23S rRNA pseudouridine2605 synthase